MSQFCKCKRWKISFHNQVKPQVVEADLCIIKPEGLMFFMKSGNGSPGVRDDLDLVKAFSSWHTVERTA